MRMGKGLGCPYGGYEVYSDVMFNLGGAAPAQNTATALNAGTGSSGTSYSPQADGVLIGVEFQLTPQAATSNAQSGFVSVTCKQWSPINSQAFGIVGFGLATAPQVIGGAFLREPYDNLWLPVKTSVPITAAVTYTFPATPVTPNLFVVGKFIAESPTAAA